MKDLIGILTEHELILFLMVVWGLSLAFVGYSIVCHSLKYFRVWTHESHAIVVRHIGMLGLLMSAQALMIISEFAHKGFQHGWEVHIVAGGDAGPLFLLGVFNISFTHLLQRSLTNDH